MNRPDEELTKFELTLRESPNMLTLVIRCHFAIESKIHETLKLFLQRSDRVDLSRMQFLTKVDLLIALGLLNVKLFPLFAEVNKMRNRFAHNPYAGVTLEDQKRIKNLLLSQTPELIPQQYVWTEIARALPRLFSVVYISMRMALERLIRGHAASYATNQLIEETLATPPPELGFSPPEFRNTVEAEYDKHVKDFLLANHPHLIKD